MNDNPVAFAMSRLDWQFFLTLSFVRETMPTSLRAICWATFVRQVAECYRVHFDYPIWFRRLESGETTGRLHYHATLGGLPAHVVNERTCLVLMSIWEHQSPFVMRKGVKGSLQKLSRFCGNARCAIYTSSLAGVEYFSKGLEDCGISSSGAIRYEVNKFGGAREVGISMSCFKVMARRNGKPADTVRLRQGGVSTTVTVGNPSLVGLSLGAASPPHTAVNHAPVESNSIRSDKCAWRDSGGGSWHVPEA